MLRFDDLQLFVRAADLGSLSAAARVMDLSAAVASAALKRIERQLGARLLARSTRSLRLTAEGEGFLEYARAALGSLEEGRRCWPAVRTVARACCNCPHRRTLAATSFCPGWTNFSNNIRS